MIRWLHTNTLTSIRIVTLPVMLLVLMDQAHASLWQPSVLNDGDQYRLIFVTSTRTTASSTLYDYYKNIVQNDAATSTFTSGTYWRALITTQDVTTGSAPDLRTRLESNAFATSDWDNSSVPIYLIGTDDIVATGWDDLWDGNAPGPINRTQTLDIISETEVWSGTDSDGSPMWAPGGGSDGNYTVGPGADPHFGVSIGTTQDLSANVTGHFMLSGSTTDHQLVELPVFGISTVITASAAPSAVPEPSSLLIMSLALASLVVVGRFRRKDHPKPRAD